MGIHPNGAGRSSLLYSDPSAGQQVIGEVLNKLKAVYGAVGSSQRVCIHKVCIRYAYC